MNTFAIVLISASGGALVGAFCAFIYENTRFNEVIKTTAKEICKLYAENRKNCPAYLIKRANNITAKKSPDDCSSNKENIVSENENAHLCDTCKIFQDGKNKFHETKEGKHYNGCCCCNHTLIDCCEVDERDIIEVINKVVARK